MFEIKISVGDDNVVRYKATGNLTSGNIKLMIGQMEQIKIRLLQDLERTLGEGYEGIE